MRADTRAIPHAVERLSACRRGARGTRPRARRVRRLSAVRRAGRRGVGAVAPRPRELRHLRQLSMVCMITAYANIDTAVAATRQGVDAFLPSRSRRTTCSA